MVGADDYHRPRVIGTVAAAAFAVVVGGVGIEAGAAVVGVAFARFHLFFGFFFFGFFPRSCFFASAFPRGVRPRPAPRFFVPFLGHDPPQPLPFRFPVGFPRCLLPRFPLGILGVGIGAAANESQQQAEQKKCHNPLERF